MHPILFQIGPLTVRSYGALVALAFLAALKLAQWGGRHRGIDEKTMMDMTVLIVFSGLLGARLFYVLINGSYYAQHPWESLMIWEGGLVFYGGFMAGALAVVYYVLRHHLSLGDVFDALVPAVALGQAVGRWGCFFAGCCYGRPTSVPWAVRFDDLGSLAPLGIPLHPTQIYESLGDVVIAFVLWMILIKTSPRGKKTSSSARRSRPKGLVFWCYLVLYGALRFTVELFRGDDRGPTFGGLYPSQLIALGAILLGVCVLIAQVSEKEELHGAVSAHHA